MVKCNNCRASFEKLEKIVIETRASNYPMRSYVKNKKTVQDSGGVGVEIVKEKYLCAKCYK